MGLKCENDTIVTFMCFPHLGHRGNGYLMTVKQSCFRAVDSVVIFNDVFVLTFNVCVVMSSCGLVSLHLGSQVVIFLAYCRVLLYLVIIGSSRLSLWFLLQL